MGMSINTRSHNASVTNIAMGFVATDGVAAVAQTFNCGFVPRYVKWLCVAGASVGVMNEWYDGMPSSIAAAVAMVTTAAGARALTGTPGQGIIIGTPAGTSAGYFTVHQSLIPASCSFAWMAVG